MLLIYLFLKILIFFLKDKIDRPHHAVYLCHRNNDLIPQTIAFLRPFPEHKHFLFVKFIIIIIHLGKCHHALNGIRQFHINPPVRHTGNDALINLTNLILHEFYLFQCIRIPFRVLRNAFLLGAMLCPIGHFSAVIGRCLFIQFSMEHFFNHAVNFQIGISADGRWAEMAVALMDRAAGQAKLPETPAVVALFAFGSRLDRDTMQLFARTHSEEVRAAAIASTGQEVLELLHGGLRPQVLVLDALLTKPSVTQVLQEISTMQPDPEPAVLVLVPVPEETAARKALGLFAQYRIMLRPYGMKNLFDEIYRMGTTDDEHRLYHLRRCCEDVLDDFGARSTLNGYRYAERMLLYALYAERPQKIGDLQQYVASEENIEIGTVTSALNRMSAGMSKRGAEPYRGLCLRCGRPENGVLSNGQLFEGLLKELRRRLEPTV